ncbi:MAG: glycosyltransferase [Verrucomicrobia bacterium]|nr:glycosyltransferase [Verrucomicrobiota bacterium]
MSKKRIAVLGFMANCPIAGVIWQMIHYLVGLQRLGHEVYYIEDLSRVPYDPVRQTVDEDDTYAVATLNKLADQFGFQGRWAFCSRFLGRERTFGLSRAAINDLYQHADALLNICGSHELNDDLLLSENLIYVESDPGVEQIKVDTGDASTLEFLRRHRALFTFGEAIVRPDSQFPVPRHGLVWHPTRQPVVTDFWKTDAPPAAGAVFTTIANLATGGKKDIAWRGENYLWSKLPEFEKFREAPARAGEPFELATTFKDPALRAKFHASGWRDTSPEAMSIDWQAYVDYIRGSKGEFTVAKDQYVRLHTGWFSDRSACYLAAGRPVITQETGFSAFYGGPEVGGLFPFSNLDEIAAAVRAINADPVYHSHAAARIARESFEAETVLRALLVQAGV